MGDSDRRTRITALRAGDAATIAQFVRDIAPIVWTACSLMTVKDVEAREAFLDIIARLRADNFALLTQYAGSRTLEASVALVSRDLLGKRVMDLLLSNPQKGWRAFEAFFATDLQRLIQRRLPGPDREETRRDAYQSICLAMIDSDYCRLKAYSGSGSFAGFVLRIADRLLIDFLRSSFGRRRGTAFRLVPVPLDHHHDIVDDMEPTPDENFIRLEDDEHLAAALDVLTRAIPTLQEDERLYLGIALSAVQTPPSREIARLMQRPVADIYKLKQRVLNRLREIISDDSAVKNWRASV